MISTCSHARPESRPDHAICAIGRYASPRADVCGICPACDGDRAPMKAYALTISAKRPQPKAFPAGPVPRNQWPLWASALSRFATGEDKGIGDTVARQLGIVGEAFKTTMRLLGAPCGCNTRRAEWNAAYPY